MLLLVVAALAAPFALLGIAEAIRPLAHVIGMTNGSGEPYLFWSGFFSDATIFVGVVVFASRHNCHARWCVRLGRHRVEGTPYVVCHQHHPEHATLPCRPTAAQIGDQVARARRPAGVGTVRYAPTAEETDDLGDPTETGG